MFFGLFGGSDAYNDQPAWADEDVDDDELSQAFDALESAGYDRDEASEMLEEAVLAGVSVGELEELVDGVRLFDGDDGDGDW